MKRKRCLDSFALLAYFNKEAGFEKVRDAMSEAQNLGGFVFMNDINVGEVYYIISRKRGVDAADYFLENVLAALPIQTVSNAFADVLSAAKIKAAHALSYADCFAADTARRNNATLMTGDPEFNQLSEFVDIEWLHR